MEAEKLKAVELAVEEERRRAAGKRQEDRAVLEQVWTEVKIMLNGSNLIFILAATKEKEEASRLREEAKREREAGRAALQGAQESQARQVELVNRLQVFFLHNNLLITDLRVPVNIFVLYGGIHTDATLPTSIVFLNIAYGK